MDETRQTKGKEINRVIQETLVRLASFLGVWTGRGSGGYPTIEGFDYAETLRVQRNRGTQYLTYEQCTDLIDPEGRTIRKSHWEAGVLRPLADGTIELACVQGSGRVEVLRGEFYGDKQMPNKLILRFESVLIENDGRVRRSGREWILDGEHFRYVMQMTTTNIKAPTRHLEANLYKVEYASKNMHG